ncbi:MAG TPA: tRNA pseudouridine(13) synthase TruD [Planctomycetota bacterium]|nr:tRNA pseudouridine(13) synthase TruD [Planctomycetota bacterium]
MLPAPRVPGRYKVEPDDFVVIEEELYPPEGRGDHLWLRVRKRGLSTLQAVEALARALGRREREFGFAGMKDAFAVTEQWISIEHVPEETARALDLPGIEVVALARHGNKLRPGHLRGNRFEILLRGVDGGHLDALRTNLAELQRSGVPNYFGEQRFGKRGANLSKGLELLHGDLRHAARRIPKKLLTLLLAAVQSEVFNRVLVRRLATMGTLLPGDVAVLHRNGAAFLVEDPAREQARCDAFELSPSGPMPGPKCLAARGEPGAIEAEVMAELGITGELFGRSPHGSNEGERRPLRMQLRDAEAAAEPQGVRLRFALPRGGYATSVLRELLVDPPWFAAR